MIPLCTPCIRNNEFERIKNCIDTEWVSYGGHYVREFEQKLCDYTGSQYCTVTVSGTSAIHTALTLVDVKPNEEVILPSLSFVAPANAIRYCGAWPTFVDVCPNTWQWDMDKLEDFLSRKTYFDSKGDLFNSITKRRIAALLPVHLLGALADIPEILKLAKAYGLPVIEDAAESLGAKWNGRGIGSSLIDDEATRITCTSFNGNKIITTGGGGAILTNSQSISDKAAHLTTTAKIDDIEFDHDQIGFNYRLTNMAAALGIGQLECISDFIERKKEIAKIYRENLSCSEQIVDQMPSLDQVDQSYWLYTILLKENSRELLHYLQKERIQSRPLWKTLPDLQYLDHCYVHSSETARDLHNRSLSIPCSTHLTKEDQMLVVESIQKYFES